MKGFTYRLKRPTLGLIWVEPYATRIPIDIPMDATVTAGEPVRGDIFVEATWESKTIWMFRQDLLARGELVATTQ